MRHTRSECRACGEVFAGTRAFDAHRVGPYIRGGRRCLTPSEMLAMGMFQDKRHWWFFDPERCRSNQSERDVCNGRDEQEQERPVSA